MELSARMTSQVRIYQLAAGPIGLVSAVLSSVRTTKGPFFPDPISLRWTFGPRPDGVFQTLMLSAGGVAGKIWATEFLETAKGFFRVESGGCGEGCGGDGGCGSIAAAEKLLPAQLLSCFHVWVAPSCLP